MPLSTESLNTIPTTDRSAVSDGRSSEYAGTVTHSVREWIGWYLELKLKLKLKLKSYFLNQYRDNYEII